MVQVSLDICGGYILEKCGNHEDQNDQFMQKIGLNFVFLHYLLFSTVFWSANREKTGNSKPASKGRLHFCFAVLQ
jgi:hypothetical protein